LHGQAFFGGTVSKDTKASVCKRMGKNIPASRRLAKFSPYVAGDTFTQADCAAWPHLPLVGIADMLLAVARGVFGAPTTFVGDQMFFGQDRLDFIREALA